MPIPVLSSQSHFSRCFLSNFMLCLRDFFKYPPSSPFTFQIFLSNTQKLNHLPVSDFSLSPYCTFFFSSKKKKKKKNSFHCRSLQTSHSSANLTSPALPHSLHHLLSALFCHVSHLTSLLGHTSEPCSLYFFLRSDSCTLSVQLSLFFLETCLTLHIFCTSHVSTQIMISNQ
jgi:hypothetical protein